MTATEKAIELSDKFLYIDEDLFCDECGMSAEAAKQCALIAVEQILDNGFQFIDDSEFWKQVKEELLKL